MTDNLFKPSRSPRRILQRAIVAFGLWYFFWLVFYFDFLKSSFQLVSRVSHPGGIMLIPLGIVILFFLLSAFVTLFTRRVSDYAFVRPVVLSGALLNLSSSFAIGYEVLAWVSTAVAGGLVVAVWKTSSHQLLRSLYICGVLGAIYGTADQAWWAWTKSNRFAAPQIDYSQSMASAENGTNMPSIYIIVMEEMSLSLVNTHANFLSLPSLSRIAREGIYFPRAYSVSDGTIWSMPSVFIGRYPSEAMLLQHEFSLEWLKHGRNLLMDLTQRGYELKIYNDLFGICRELACSHFEINTRSVDLLSTKQLAWFAADNLIRYLSFGWHQADVISGLMQGQAERIFELGHSRYRPQLVYIHLFDSHHNYKRTRNGSVHTSPYQTFRGVPAADADKVAANYFEQILWADRVSRPLIDSLLAIPPEERILVFLSDHGVSWREPPFYRETGWLNSAQVHVPVVLVAPDLEPDISAEPLPLIDIYPTLIDLLSRAQGGFLEQPRDIDGLSLFASESKRRDRSHYAFSVGCKYELVDSTWNLVKRFKAQGSGHNNWKCADQPIPAKELARTAEASEKAVRDSLSPKPLPDSKPDQAGSVPQAPMESMEGEIVHMEEEGYRGYNILRYRDLYYGIRQSDGEFIHEKFLNREYAGAVTGKTAADVRQAIADLGLSNPAPILIEEGYLGYNIILYEERFYGIRQSDGEFNHVRFKEGRYNQAYSDLSVTGLKRAVAGSREHSSGKLNSSRKANGKQ